MSQVIAWWGDLPPDTLGPRERTEWPAIVDRLGSDWFSYAMRRPAAFCAATAQLTDVNEGAAASGPELPADPQG
jgi:hypothetical protein